MARVFKKTVHTGLRYFEHESRKHGKKLDRYYIIRFRLDGKLHTFGIGWLSDGIPESIRKEEPNLGFEDYCLKLLREYKNNVKIGAGPVSPKEKREIAENEREQLEAARLLAEKENITFGQFMTETYLPQCKQDKRPKTYEFENMFYKKHLADAIGGLTFPAISPFQIEKIKKTMKDKKLSPRYIQYALQIIRQVFNKAHKLGIFNGESPTKAVDWPKLDNAKMRYLSIAETEKLLKALAEKSKNLHDMALLSLHCGLRFGEIAGLTWSCINLEQGTITVLNAKTGSRTAYLTDRAKEMLKGRKRGQANELIFPKRTVSAGTMVKPSRAFTRTVDELGFNQNVTDRKMHVTFHTLRHTYATHLYEGTHDLYLTQKSLGHTTSTMTQRYAKMNESRLREGAAAIQQAFLAGQKEAEAPTGQVLAFPG
jgi:integrase